jgi:hypothetical protein
MSGEAWTKGKWLWRSRRHGASALTRLADCDPSERNHVRREVLCVVNTIPIVGCRMLKASQRRHELRRHFQGRFKKDQLQHNYVKAIQKNRLENRLGTGNRSSLMINFEGATLWRADC